MLNIIKSGFTSGGHERIKAEILKQVELGERVLLIVPEQQTVMAEAEMTDLLPPGAPLIFEVTNFTRLANTAARALGGISGEYCDKTKRALVMWRVLTELSPALSSSGGIVNEGLVTRYLAATTQMDGLGVSADQLINAADSEFIKDSRLKAKLHDLSSVQSLYKNLLSEKYGNSDDDSGRMLIKLRENPEYLCDTRIYIEGFTSFTETQYALISELSKRLSLTVLIYLSHTSQDSFEYTEVRRTVEKLKRSARQGNSDIRIFNENSRTNSDETISLIGDLLWRNIRGFDKLSLQNLEKIRILEAETPFDECEFIASDIRRRVMGGASYSDFAIVARNAQKYRGILDTALALGDVPAFISHPCDVSALEAIKLIYTAYAIIRSGFARENVITYAKCALAGISRDECDELEYYTEKWQINGLGFSGDDSWNMSPDGYTTSPREGNNQKLQRLNSIRQRLIEPLIAFSDSVRNATTVKEQATALVDHLVAIGVPSSLEARAAALYAMGESSSAEESQRTWGIICDALDTLVEVNGFLKSDLDSFVGQLKICFGAFEISRIPAYVDEVTVGSADMLRLYGKKHLYLMGVNAGEFPGNITDNAYFTDSDKAALLRAGLSISPELEERGARELYIFTRALTYARDTITVTYSAKDTKYKSHECSEAIGKLISIFDGSLKVKKITEMSTVDKLWSAEGALLGISELKGGDAQAAKTALKEAGFEPLLKLCEESITNDNLKIDSSIIRPDKTVPISLTQSRIDSFANCPFSHFCRYTLNLTAEERAEFDHKNIGTFIHAILENVFREIASSKLSAKELSREERIALTEAAAKKYISDLGETATNAPAHTKIKLGRLVRAAMPVVDSLCDELTVSKFEPKFFELSITKDKEDSPEPVTVKTERENEIYVYGFIDRVDTYQRGDEVFVRVVDYKTGAKTFSPEDLAEGKNLQMFLYLKAILDTDKKNFAKALGAEGKRVLPAGVIYIKTNINDHRVDTPDDQAAELAIKQSQKREGMVLDDEDVIAAMGLKYTPLYSARTPDKIPDSKRHLLFTENKFDDLMNDALSSVTELADRMAEGDIRAVPKLHDGKTYCDNCEFKPICRSAVIK